MENLLLDRLLGVKMIEIKEVETEKDLDAFASVVYDIYRDNPYYVFPLYNDYKNYVKGNNNRLLSCPHKLFIAVKNNRTVGRIIAYIDQELNSYHNSSIGYISQYESIDDMEVAKALLDKCKEFFNYYNIKIMRGPVSLPDGDDNRGLLTNAFDELPSVMNVYNPSYYNDQFIQYGFTLYHDVFAYKSDKDSLMNKIEKLSKLLPQIQKRYAYHTETVNLKNIDQVLKDVFEVLDKSIPASWEDFIPVKKSDVRDIFEQMKSVVIEDLIVLAKNSKDEPIGFALTLPDYNEVLVDFKGKLNLINKIKFVFKKNKIKRVRMFVLMVVPEYRNKGVTSSIYYHVFKNAVKMGFTVLEGSTIWDYNKEMINDIEKFGAVKDKIYRVYQINL